MHFRLAVLAAALAVTPSTASAQADVLAPIHRFVDAFNQGDYKGAAASCADAVAILDEFPPHEWHGAGACTRWMNDYDADAKKHGITDGKVTLGTPRHVDVTGDRAYVVIPSDYAYKLGGKPTRESGSMFSFALQKGPAGWRILAWSWAKD